MITVSRKADNLIYVTKTTDLPRLIVLEKTKNNERKVIPMNDTENVTVAFGRACKKAGIEDFRLHDLRHHFASYLTMAGQNQRTVQELLGHKTPAMTARYSHLSPEHLKGAVASLEGIFDVQGGEEQSQESCPGAP